jgi:hypothetical protein
MSVLAMSCSEVSLEICPSLVRCFLLGPSAVGAHRIEFGKDLSVALRMAHFIASYLRKFSTILDMLEEGLHWLLRVPILLHLFDFFSRSTAVMLP